MSAAGCEYLADWMRQIAMDPAYDEWANDMDAADRAVMEAEYWQDTIDAQYRANTERGNENEPDNA